MVIQATASRMASKPRKMAVMTATATTTSGLLLPSGALRGVDMAAGLSVVHLGVVCRVFGER